MRRIEYPEREKEDWELCRVVHVNVTSDMADAIDKRMKELALTQNEYFRRLVHDDVVRSMNRS